MSSQNTSIVNTRGVTIQKSQLTNTVIKDIKKELTLVPVSTFGNFESTSINVFQETKENLTVPLYYARSSRFLKHFKEEIDYSKTESVVFPSNNFQLRAGVQSDCYSKCMLEKEKDVGGGIVNLQTGQGKCLGVDTEIVMNDGSVKKVQDIVVGDMLLGEHELPCMVTSTIKGREPLFRICYVDGSFVCNASHMLCVKNDIKILDLFNQGVEYGVSYFCPQTFKKSLIKCKTLGIALLTKSFLINKIGVLDISLVNYLINECSLSMYRRIDPVDHWESNGKTLSECYDIGRSFDAEKITRSRSGTLQERKKILEGILSSERILTYEIFKSLMFLQGSLGGVTSVPFSVEPLKYGDYYGFELTGNRRFVLADFTVTHNTVLGIKLISSFEQKSLIIVNKVQLMKQWTQELLDKIPGIKIGTIQGKKFETEGCQVVIGMLQTLVLNKDITHESLCSFGMCVIDEVHGIGSEVFSKIMFKIRPKYLFGLTATLERKDKMEKMIMWYTGSVLFSDISKLKQKTDITFVPFKGVSSREILLRDGTPAVSSMISNISLDKERIQVLVDIIKDLAQNQENHILVLSDRTAQLKALNGRLPGISGLFIGSLKPEVLAKNREAQVILATYGMASEGFNVPRLNCLVFATPRSSVTQSIGRIYRKIHQRPPVIVDIVDNFSIFSRQQYARRKIYKKNISGSDDTGLEALESGECLLHTSSDDDIN